jgi:hypothetical protein
MLVLRQLLTILLLLCCLVPLGTPLGMVLCFVGQMATSHLSPSMSAPTALLHRLS